MTDFRALCAELADSIELLLEMRPVEAKPLQITEDRLARARAALAEPEPEEPTDEELLAALKEAIIAFPPNHPSAQHLSSVKYEIELQLRKARAILARWGK